MRCETCGQAIHFVDDPNRRCEDRWFVWRADGSRDDAILIYADSAQEAAEAWADESDAFGDFEIVNGDDPVVAVQDTDCGVSYWVVTGEAVPQYTASQTEEPE